MWGKGVGKRVRFYMTPPKKLGPPGPTRGTKDRKEKPRWKKTNLEITKKTKKKY